LFRMSRQAVGPTQPPVGYREVKRQAVGPTQPPVGYREVKRQAVGPTQPPVGYREVKQPGCEFDHLVQRVRMSGATPLLSLSCHGTAWAYLLRLIEVY